MCIMKYKTLNDFLYAGHMVKSYIDGYGKSGTTPPTPPTPTFETWNDMSSKTWGFFLDNGYKWEDLGATA